MDKYYSTTIQQYILSSRIKTKRQKKRAQKENRDKRLIQLWKELQKVRTEQRQQGYVDLIAPIMRGWKRYFVLRSDIGRTKDAALFEGILEKINTTQYSHRKDFKKKKRKFGRKIYAERDQQLKKLCAYCFKKANFTEKQMQFFEVRYEMDSCTKKLAQVYVFTQPWRFALRVRPNMITKMRVTNVELEKREKEIDSYLKASNRWHRLRYLLDGSSKYRWYDHQKDVDNRFKNKSIVEILDIIKTEMY